jgi:hypothetical protein
MVIGVAWFFVVKLSDIKSANSMSIRTMMRNRLRTHIKLLVHSEGLFLACGLMFSFSDNSWAVFENGLESFSLSLTSFLLLYSGMKMDSYFIEEDFKSYLLSIYTL